MNDPAGASRRIGGVCSSSRGRVRNQARTPMVTRSRTGGAPLPAGRTRPSLHSIGIVRSSLRRLADAPKQRVEGAPDAWLEIHASAVEGLAGISVGDKVIVLTWLHKARRDVLQV